MIAMSLSKHDQRVLLVGAVAIGGLFAVGRGWPRVSAWTEGRRDSALASLRQDAQASDQASLLPVYTDSLNARRRRLAALDTMLIAGATVAEAGAALSNAVSDYADSHAVRVVSMQVRPDTIAVRGYAHVAVRLIGVADVNGLTSLLSDIESGTPVLAVREIAITQPDPTVASSKPEALRFELLVEALAVIGKGPA